MRICDSWIVKIVFRIVGHSQFFHDPTRGVICGNGDRDYFFQSELRKGIPQNGSRSFCRQAPVPDFWHQAPSDFYSRLRDRRQLKAHRLQPDKSDKFGCLPQFRCKKTKAGCLVLSLEAGYRGVAFFATQHRGKKFSDTRVRVHFCEGRQILIFPGANAKPLRFNHSNGAGCHAGQGTQSFSRACGAPLCTMYSMSGRILLASARKASWP